MKKKVKLMTMNEMLKYDPYEGKTLMETYYPNGYHNPFLTILKTKKISKKKPKEDL